MIVAVSGVPVLLVLLRMIVAVFDLSHVHVIRRGEDSHSVLASAGDGFLQSLFEIQAVLHDQISGLQSRDVTGRWTPLVRITAVRHHHLHLRGIPDRIAHECPEHRGGGDDHRAVGGGPARAGGRRRVRTAGGEYGGRANGRGRSEDGHEQASCVHAEIIH